MVAAVERGELVLAGREQLVGARGGEAREDREPERAAHHERRVDDARREAGLARLDVAHRGEQHRVERHAGAEAEQEHARQDVDDEAPVDGCPREEHEADGGQQQPDRQRRSDAEAHDDLGREADRERSHDQIRRQEGETDLERAVAEHELEVERGQEEPREHGRRPEHADDVRGRDVAQPEEAERHQRRRRRAPR